MANGSLLSTKVGIPFLQKQFTVLEHKPSNDREFVTSKTPVRRSCHRLEPELRIAARMRHMNVWWLTIFKAVEEEPIAPTLSSAGMPSVYRQASGFRTCGLSARLANGFGLSRGATRGRVGADGSNVAERPVEPSRPKSAECIGVSGIHHAVVHLTAAAPLHGHTNHLFGRVKCKDTGTRFSKPAGRHSVSAGDV